MKIVHLTHSTHGGAGIAALRLVLALQQQGLQVVLVSSNRCIGFDGKEYPSDFFNYQKPTIGSRITTKLFRSNSLKIKAKRALQPINTKLNYEVASLPFSNFKLSEHPLVQEADLIHLHWIGSFLDYKDFFGNINKPLVWTLHDCNPFQGFFHYEYDEKENAHVIGALDAKIKAYKQQYISEVKDLTIVSPSRWLLQKAKASQVFNDRTKFKEIPNTISIPAKLQQEVSRLRKDLKIEKDAFVLLYVADLIATYRKGGAILVEALEMMDRPVTVITIGKGKLRCENPNIRVVEAGFVTDARLLSSYYQLASFFVLPSLEDNLPNTMLESLANGTPVIGFATGGIAEHLIQVSTGILAKDRNARSLKDAILLGMSSQDEYNEATIRSYAKEHFGNEVIASRFHELYQEGLKNIKE